MEILYYFHWFGLTEEIQLQILLDQPSFLESVKLVLQNRLIYI